MQTRSDEYRPRAPGQGRQESARHRRQLDRHARLRDELHLAQRDRDQPDARRPRACSPRCRRRRCPRRARWPTRIHIGKELYNTSIGEFDPAPSTTTPITGRMSNNGWGSCAACHSPFATTDNVVWIFPAGPRKSIPQHTDFDHTDPDAQQDARAAIGRRIATSRKTSRTTSAPCPAALASSCWPTASRRTPTPPDLLPTPPAVHRQRRRNQLKVRGVGGWDAIKAFVQFGIRSPISPVAKTEPDVVAGRALFQSANCQSCHGGPQWTSSTINFKPPPTAAQVVAGQLVDQLRNVGTFDPTRSMKSGRTRSRRSARPGSYRLRCCRSTRFRRRSSTTAARARSTKCSPM